ncbi:MAG: hypothetical protein MI976_29660 [Pseudomonadales bacterium]|nr:hypothetical protein [Pseudomonadales bacterium]
MSQAKAFKRHDTIDFGEKENITLANDWTMGNNNQPDFHGAAIIDADGNEIPITEAMVQRACNELKNSWLFPRKPGE